MALDYEKRSVYRSSSPIRQKILCHLMQNKLSSVGAELEIDRCKDVEVRELNDKEKFNSQVLFLQTSEFISHICLEE